MILIEEPPSLSLILHQLALSNKVIMRLVLLLSLFALFATTAVKAIPIQRDLRLQPSDPYDRSLQAVYDSIDDDEEDDGGCNDDDEAIFETFTYHQQASATAEGPTPVATNTLAISIVELEVERVVVNETALDDVGTFEVVEEITVKEIVETVLEVVYTEDDGEMVVVVVEEHVEMLPTAEEVECEEEEVEEEEEEEEVEEEVGCEEEEIIEEEEEGEEGNDEYVVEEEDEENEENDDPTMVTGYEIVCNMGGEDVECTIDEITAEVSEPVGDDVEEVDGRTGCDD